MKNENRPVLITCGDPAGVGPEVAVSAWKALKEEIPLCLIIDPEFLPSDIDIKILSEPPNSKDIVNNTLTVLIRNLEIIELSVSQTQNMPKQ